MRRRRRRRRRRAPPVISAFVTERGRGGGRRGVIKLPELAAAAFISAVGSDAVTGLNKDVSISREGGREDTAERRASRPHAPL